MGRGGDLKAVAESTSASALDPERDTFPKLVRDNARRRPDKVAIREKDFGIWQAYTWSRYFAQARLIALGLASLGFARGDRVAIVGDNRPQLYWAVMAAQALGGVPVPIYQDSIEREMEYIIEHSEARFAVVESLGQVDKLLGVRARCRSLRHVIYDDARGMRGYREPGLLSLVELSELGKKFEVSHPAHFDAELARGGADDTAIICYTSGTTGAPKGAMLSHRNLITTARNAAHFEGLREDEDVLSYLPMAWVGDHVFSYAQAIVKPLSGMTEASVFVTIQRDGDVRLDTVGTPIPGVEIRISDAGEVLFRSPGVFQGYAKNPEATRQTLDGGWIHSGDAGFLDHDGHLVIIDRAKDVSRLADGTMFAPKFIENKLKFSPYVREAVCIGQARPCVTAFINIDLAAVGSWAERRNIAYTSYGDLAQKPDVYELIRGEVERVNASLAEDETLRGAQVKRFLILHKELDPDDEEITRTRKVRRGYIAQKYATLIDAVYSGQDHVQVDAKVTYEDGRTGTMRADVQIRDVDAVPAQVAR